jgi:hypothetical protein
MATVFLAPVAAYLLITRIARRMQASPRWQRAAGIILSTAVLFTVSPMAFVVAVCWGPPAGTMETSVALMHDADSVVAALDRYQAATGRYPDALIVLVPDLLAGDRLRRVQPGGSFYSLDYRRDRDGGYVMEFREENRGMSKCAHEAGAAKWHCYAYL